MKIKEVILDFFVALVLLLFFLLSSIQIASFKPVVFFLQDTVGVYEEVSLTREVIKKVTGETLDYVKGADVELPYTLREKFHLTEVRALFLNARKYWLVSVVLVFTIILLTHVEVLQWEERMKVITRGLTIFFLILDLCVLFSFFRFFEVLHKILFSPGTWEFTKDSLLTTLFPYQFWVSQTVFVLSFSAFLSAISSFFLRLLLSPKRIDLEAV